ncbi:GatB/YqeY domain-containing protein [Ectobacillus sp. sgz5001026]|uniref:GatB/YqeY domain-containing protein n=1 Tax=Ectobacillus sp. sgz5001026 TaxID=3242473 RepID=UPI0036D3BA23
MSLLDRLNEDIKQAMKSKEKDRLSVIRMVKSSLKYEEIKLGQELTEEQELTVLSREMKQRKDSLLEFEKAGREDLVDKVKDEVKVLEVYLPEQLSEEELTAIIKQAIADIGASSKADMGKVMGKVIPSVKGKADGSLVNKLVSQLLA